MFSEISIQRLKDAYTKEGLVSTRTDNVAKMLSKRFHKDEPILELTQTDIENLLLEEKEELVLDQKEHRLNFDKILIEWLQQTPFFLELSRWISKRPSSTIPTACVTFNFVTEDIELLYNPRWIASLETNAIKGLIQHEFYHLIYRHITARARKPQKDWNIATDLAINSIIKSQGGVLPAGGLIPGEPTEHVYKTSEALMWRSQSQINRQKLYDTFFESLDKMLASDVYFELLAKWRQETGIPGDGDGDDVNSVDSHDQWENIPADAKALVEDKIKQLVKRAVDHADSKPNGWGNMSEELRNEIRDSVNDAVDWRSLLRNFVGMLCRADRATSIKRINRRFPMIHPGSRRGHTARLLIAIDQSGSVDDEQLNAIFGCLRTLSKKISFTVVMFDTEVAEAEMFQWDKGATPTLRRVRCGGTDLDAPTQFANRQENRGKWDGLIICTDGECSPPGPSRIKRAYVITPGHKLMFETDELVVNMDLSPETKSEVVR